jgi:hypothetical protein
MSFAFRIPFRSWPKSEYLPATTRWLLPALLLAGVASAQPGQDPLNRIKIRGKDMFMNGINMAWNNWGEDLTRYDSAVFGNMFRSLAAAGGNSVRWWMHCDGQATPSYDAQGKVTGMPEQAFVNMGRMLDLAAANKILLMPVLWSFDMANRNHANLILDSAYTNSYIRTVLTPLVTRYKGHPGLLAWEICNEPEWMLDDDGSTTQRVTKAQLQRFHGLLAAAIHRADPGALVTTGSASFKWNSPAPGAKGNYYSDQALQAAAGGDPGARLDFYQIHYYSWMRGQGWTYSPWDKRMDSWGLDKPVVIGELPAKGEAGYLDPVQMHVKSVDSGYAGVMSWAFLDNRTDKEGAWADAKPGIEAVFAKIPLAIPVALHPLPRPALGSGAFPRVRMLDSRSFALAGMWGKVEVSNPNGSILAGQVAAGIGETVWQGAGRMPPGRYFIRAAETSATASGPAQGALLFVSPDDSR